MRMDIDAAIDDIARRQHGAFHVRQVLAAGGDHALVARRVARARWRRLDGPVLVLPSHPRTWEQRVMAATLGHPTAVLSGPPAAALWGIEGVGRGRPEVTVPRGTRHRSAIASVRRSDVVERRTIGAIPVNSLPLVLIQLAAVRPRRAAALVESAVVQRLTDAGLLRDAHVRWAPRGVPGTALLGRVLRDHVDGEAVPESVLEVAGRALLAHPEIPPAVAQAAFPWAPAGPHRVDFLIEVWKLIVECDGRRWHARMAQMEADARRDLAAAAHGYLTIRLGHASLTRDVDRCRAELIAAGCQRGGVWPPR